MAIFNIIFILGAAVSGAVFGYIIRQKLAQKQANSIEATLKERIEKVRDEAKKYCFRSQRKSRENF